MERRTGPSTEHGRTLWPSRLHEGETSWTQRNWILCDQNDPSDPPNYSAWTYLFCGKISAMYLSCTHSRPPLLMKYALHSHSITSSMTEPPQKARCPGRFNDVLKKKHTTALSTVSSVFNFHETASRYPTCCRMYCKRTLLGVGNKS